MVFSNFCLKFSRCVLILIVGLSAAAQAEECFVLKVSPGYNFIPGKVCFKELSYSDVHYGGDDADLLEIDSDIFKGTLGVDWISKSGNLWVGEVSIEKVVPEVGACEPLDILNYKLEVSINPSSLKVVQANALNLVHSHWVDVCHSRQPTKIEYRYSK